MALDQQKTLTGKALAIGIGGIIVLLALLCIVFSLLNANTQVVTTTSTPDCSIVADRAEVVRVIDGDTFEAQVGDEVLTVRLIGVDTPESVNPDESKNTEEGVIASDHLKERLPEGTTVWLETDTSDVDKYGRALRYVWTKDPCVGDLTILDMLNGELVNDGFAVPKAFEPDTKYKDYFDDLYAKLQNALPDGNDTNSTDTDTSTPSVDIDVPDVDIQTPDSSEHNSNEPDQYLFI